MRRRPELVLLQVHEANDSPPSLLIISGWESPVPLDPADQVLDEAMRDVVSDGTIRRFVGRALAETMGI